MPNWTHSFSCHHSQYFKILVRRFLKRQKGQTEWERRQEARFYKRQSRQMRVNELSTAVRRWRRKGENRLSEQTIPKWLKNWQHQGPLDTWTKVRRKGSAEMSFWIPKFHFLPLPRKPPRSISTALCSGATAVPSRGIGLEAPSGEGGGHTEDVQDRRPRHDWRKGGVQYYNQENHTEFYMPDTGSSPDSLPAWAPGRCRSWLSTWQSFPWGPDKVEGEDGKTGVSGAPNKMAAWFIQGRPADSPLRHAHGALDRA